ncbi:MAG: site-specific DNA-methyltransferase [Nitrosomonas sp.]|nr:site-specific DNA-methyltransferase [Nitrosomonas sp.]
MSKYDDLVKKLKEIFQIDRPELDFGIYRIFNARAAEINHYLEHRLKEKVRESLATTGEAQSNGLKEELEDKVAQYRADGIDPDTVPKVREIREQLSQYGDSTVEHENSVFSHLLTFFSRYYDKGDFISQRRYKGDTYAIPYAGEEVVLHWANKDQYYIKSSESFANYAFKLDNGRTVRTVRFRLVTADTAKDNRKDNDKERRFVLIEPHNRSVTDDDGEEYKETLLPVTEENNADGQELVLRFEYRAMTKGNPGSKQDKLVNDAVETILNDDIVKTRWLDLSQRAPTEKNPQRTLLEKHLTQYTTRNTADYFIHKNLGGFLRNELDFYIKNEVMHLDDVQHAETFAAIEKNLRQIQTLRAIALDLIDFLAQLEDFQKKLWLKKKFVTATHYCLTLDRVPQSLYPAIAANPQQWTQWEQLGMLAEDKTDLFNQGEAGSVDYLQAHPYLMVDTALFDAAFKQQLLAAIDHLDDNLDGLLIHGDNFQALNLLQERYREQVKCVYIDPPYNTDASAISYKNGYKSSSWVSLMDSRISRSRDLLTKDGVLVAAIDDAQQRELSFLMSRIFDSRILGTVSVRSNPSGRPTQSGYAVSHEYLLFAGATSDSVIGRLPPTVEQMARFNQHDEDGVFEWRNLRREGSNSDRSARRALYYPIYIDGEKIRVPKMSWSDITESWVDIESPKAGEQVVYPNNDDGAEKTWRWEGKTVMTSLKSLAVRKDRSGKNYIYYKRRPNEEGIVSVSSWFDAKHSSTEHGTALLKHLFGGSMFLYPKSIHAVVDAIYIAGASKTNALILDYFGGSGTTAHAVINLNREDNGRRKYILVEQGEYFDTVLKPRIQKVVYSADWKNGKATAHETGISHAFKVLKIESYEDALNNLQLKRDDAQQTLFDTLPQETKDDYLLRYMLEIESRGSLLSVTHFNKPFDCRLKVTVDSAGAYEERAIDLVETFNYLIGLRVKHVDMHLNKGFVTVTGWLPSGEKTLVLWRDVERVDYEQLNRLCDKLAINPADSEFEVVYINGDHNIPAVFTSSEAEGGITKTLKIRQIEAEFLNRMFAVDDV